MTRTHRESGTRIDIPEHRLRALARQLVEKKQRWFIAKDTGPLIKELHQLHREIAREWGRALMEEEDPVLRKRLAESVHDMLMEELQPLPAYDRYVEMNFIFGSLQYDMHVDAFISEDGSVGVAGHMLPTEDINARDFQARLRPSDDDIIQRTDRTRETIQELIAQRGRPVDYDYVDSLLSSAESYATATEEEPRTDRHVGALSDAYTGLSRAMETAAQQRAIDLPWAMMKRAEALIPLSEEDRRWLGVLEEWQPKYVTDTGADWAQAQDIAGLARWAKAFVQRLRALK